MKRYVSLDALVAEVERRMKLRQHSYEKYKQLSDFITFEELEYFHDEFIPTLEVKEVDLDKDIRTYLTNRFNIYEDGVLQSKKSGLPLSAYDIIKVAEHFFELGLKTQKGE